MDDIRKDETGSVAANIPTSELSAAVTQLPASQPVPAIAHSPADETASVNTALPTKEISPTQISPGTDMSPRGNPTETTDNKDPDTVSIVVVNSAERADKTKQVFSKVNEKFHPVKHKNRLSDAEMDLYFSLDDSLDLFHGHEKAILQQYKDDNPIVRSCEFSNKYSLYDEAWDKYDYYLSSKKRKLLEISDLLGTLADESLREELQSCLCELHNNQKMMDFAREKLCARFHAIQIDEIKILAEKNIEKGAILEGISKIHNAQDVHTRSLDNIQNSLSPFNKFGEDVVALLGKMLSRMSSGGLFSIKEILESAESREICLQYAERLLKVPLSKEEWGTYALRRQKLSLKKIATMIGKDKSTVSRSLRRIDRLLEGAGLPSGLVFYEEWKVSRSYNIDKIIPIDEIIPESEELPED